MYTKTSWVARVGTALNRFLKTNETSTEVELTNDPTGVTTAGTPFTVDNMNKIEEGIYDAHVVLDNNINQGVKTTDSPTFASVDTGQGANELYPMDQGVKTTDNVTFSRLGIITTIRQLIFNGSTTGVMDDINIGELVNLTFQGWSHSTSQLVCILPSGSLFCVALVNMMDGAALSTGVKTGGETIATVESGLPGVYGVLRIWRIA